MPNEGDAPRSTPKGGLKVSPSKPSIKQPFGVGYTHGRKARYSGNPGTIPGKPEVGYLQKKLFKS